MKQIYKITYPTGKIYIGKDSIGSARYMGSPNLVLVNDDFKSLPDEQQQSYSVHKEILWQSESATEQELATKEVEFIRRYRSNNPSIGYNRWPTFLVDETDAYLISSTGPALFMTTSVTFFVACCS